MRPPKIVVHNLTLAGLIDSVRRGEIRIPRFQRAFVWGKTDVTHLLDSMQKEFPIGTIFLWDAPAEYNGLLRDIPELKQPPVRHGHGHRIILDGQQRVTSLYAVISALEIRPVDYGKFVVDLDEDGTSRQPASRFSYRQPDNQRYVAICELLSNDFLHIYNDLTDARRKVFQTVQLTLTGYPFSVVTVTVDNLHDAVVIFERINRRGRRLSRYDLICAGVWSQEFDLRELTEKEIVDKHKPSFGKIPEARVPQALALLTKDGAEERAQFALQTEEIQAVWSETVEGFRLAVGFLRTNLGVARSEFLPYDAVLPVLVKYFHESGTKSVESAEHLRQLFFWFWRSAFSLRFGSSTDTRITEDAQWVKRLIAVDMPYPLVQLEELDLTSLKMSATSAVARGILCLLNLRQPLHFKSKAKINIGTPHFSTFTKAERHHIFPAGFLVQHRMKKHVHALPNFCFIPADLNKRISDRAPSDYMAEIRDSYADRGQFERVMNTHLIPVGDDSGIWVDDYDLFLQQRAALLMHEIRQLCGIGYTIAPAQRDSAVNRVEVALRDLIHERLCAMSPNYWKRNIPGGVRQRAGEADQRNCSKDTGRAYPKSIVTASETGLVRCRRLHRSNRQERQLGCLRADIQTQGRFRVPVAELQQLPRRGQAQQVSRHSASVARANCHSLAAHGDGAGLSSMPSHPSTIFTI